MMSAVVIDTNVPVVANGHTVQAGPDCVIACIDALDDAMQKRLILLDDTEQPREEIEGGVGIDVSHLREQADELAASMEGQIDELVREMPQLNVRMEIMSRVLASKRTKNKANIASTIT